MRYDSMHARRQRLLIVHVGELSMAATYLKNRTPQKALKMETPFKMFGDEQAELLNLRVAGARTFVLIKGSRKLDVAAWEGKVCGYSKERKPDRVWNPKTRRIVESKKATFIETPPHLLPPPSQLSPSQDLVPLLWNLYGDTLDNDFILHDGLLRGITGYTDVLDFTTNIPANHENTSSVSADPQVQGLVDQIRDLTRRDLLAAPSPAAILPAESFPGAARGPASEGALPRSRGGASLETKELSPGPVPATARRGTTMHDNRIPRPNIVTRRTPWSRRARLLGTGAYAPTPTTTGSGGTFSVEYAERAATTGSLH